MILRNPPRALSLLSFALLLGLVGGPESLASASEIGKAVADFELRDTAGRLHRLTEYRGKKAVVLAFNGIGCPISELYAGKLRSIASRYRDRDVQLLGINSNRQDTVQELRAFTNEFELPFPLLKDHHNTVADQLGARRTTEVFLLDAELRLRYRGAIDDQYTLTARSVGVRKDRAEKEYLLDALAAVLAGEEVALAETKPVGCVIGREREVAAAAEVTFHGQVEAIFQRKCQPCHREGQIAPFPLLSYDDAAGWAGMIQEVVETRRMPPWHADPSYGKFSNDRSLSPEERDTILAWVEQGTPRGDPRKRPEPVRHETSWQIGKPDVVYEMPSTFKVKARGKVDYKYFLVPTGLEEERWVRAMEIVPGEREVVHHILVFCVDPKNPRQAMDEARGGARSYFAAMVPGERPVIYPEGMAKRMPAGSTLVFQVHYTPNGTPREDRSKIGIVFGEKPAKGVVRTRSAYARRGLNIPAGARNHEERAYTRFSRDSRILGLLPHMHLRGSSFKYIAHYPVELRLSKSPEDADFPPSIEQRIRLDTASGTTTWTGELTDEILAQLIRYFDTPEDRKQLEAARKEARSEILLSVPGYDFGWQSTYRFAEPKLVPGGTTLEAIAVYDNSPSNPALTRELWSRKVGWGEQTWDEMLIGYFDYVYVGEEG